MTNFEKNIAAIKLINPTFAQKICDAIKPYWIDNIRCLSGEANIIITSGAKKTTIYEMESPCDVAKEKIKSETCYKEDVTLLLGLGLGYLVREIIKKMEINFLSLINKKRIISKTLDDFLKIKEKSDAILYRGHHIIVIEPCLYLINQTFKLFDFSEYLKAGALLIVSEKKEMLNYLGALETQLNVCSWFMTTYPYTLLRPEYAELGTYAADYTNQLRCNTGTVAGQGAKIADNGIAALPYTIRHRGVKELFGIFKNRPAICVSTGPSLEKNIHLLKDIQNKVIIVAVAQALRILLAYDIRPDFICTVDFGEVNMGHLNGLMDSDVPLVCLDRTYAPLLQQYRGPKFIAATPPNPGFEEKANGILKNKGYLEMGGSVAHMCLSLAISMGCEPITLIGQDLSYHNDNSHNPLADASGKIKISENNTISWDVKDQRCSLYGQKSYQMGGVRKVRGYFDDVVITNMGLASFITAFENIITQYYEVHPNNIIYNSTEGGAYIGGFERKPLKYFIDIFCNETIDKQKIGSLLSFADDSESLINEVIPLLNEDICIFKKIILYCEKGIETTKQLEININNKHELKKILSKNTKYSNKAYHESIKIPLILLSIVGANRKIQSREMNVCGAYEHIINDADDLKIRIKRNNHILSSAKKAAESLKISYLKTLNTLKKYKKNKHALNPTKNDYLIDFSDVTCYLNAGNWAHPLLDAKKVIDSKSGFISYAQTIKTLAESMRDDEIKCAIGNYNERDEKFKLIKYNELIENSQKEGRENKNFKKSLDLLSEAIKLMPDNSTAYWGMATTYHHLNKLDESLVEYEKLIKKFPASYIFKFEYGQVLIKAHKIEEGLKNIIEVMEKTKEFDAFLPVIGDIYYKNKKYDEAISAYTVYLDRCPFDYFIMKKAEDCLIKIGKPIEALEYHTKIDKIKGND